MTAVDGRVLAVVDVVELVPSLDLSEDFLDQLDIPGTARVVDGFDQVHALVPGSSGLVFFLVRSCAFLWVCLVRACVCVCALTSHGGGRTTRAELTIASSNSPAAA